MKTVRQKEHKREENMTETINNRWRGTGAKDLPAIVPQLKEPKKSRKSLPIHWIWYGEGKTFCGKKQYALRLAGHLKDVTCKMCQKVYMKCERLGYWD